MRYVLDISIFKVSHEDESNRLKASIVSSRITHLVLDHFKSCLIFNLRALKYSGVSLSKKILIICSMSFLFDLLYSHARSCYRAYEYISNVLCREFHTKNGLREDYLEEL